MFGLKLEPGLTYYLIHYALLALFAILVSLIYFRARKAKGGTGNGFLLGMTMLITGIVLDSLITVPLWIKDYDGFFFNFYLILGLIETWVITTVIGMVKK